MDPARKRATYADLRALGDDARAELIEGVLITAPPPLPEHGRAQRAIGRFVGGPFDDDDGRGGPGGWWILPEIELELAGEVVRPDMAGWRRQRLPSPWGNRPVRVVPDWIAEVLSPANARHDRLVKAELYCRAGVEYYWIVDPGERLLEAFQARDGSWLRLGAWDGSAVARIPPFDAIELELSRFFPPRAAARTSATTSST